MASRLICLAIRHRKLVAIWRLMVLESLNLPLFLVRTIHFPANIPREGATNPAGAILFHRERRGKTETQICMLDVFRQQTRLIFPMEETGELFRRMKARMARDLRPALIDASSAHILPVSVVVVAVVEAAEAIKMGITRSAMDIRRPLKAPPPFPCVRRPLSTQTRPISQLRSLTTDLSGMAIGHSL
jgi:hypothetical protein